MKVCLQESRRKDFVSHNCVSVIITVYFMVLKPTALYNVNMKSPRALFGTDKACKKESWLRYLLQTVKSNMMLPKTAQDKKE